MHCMDDNEKFRVAGNAALYAFNMLEFEMERLEERLELKKEKKRKM